MNLYQQMEDSHLVLLFQKGDSRAFDEIDRRYRDKLFRFLSLKTHCSSDAEELAQKTLLQAFQSLTQLKTGNSLANWLYQIARNMRIDELRKSRPQVFSETFSNNTQTETDFNETLFDSNPNPAQIVAQTEISHNIWAIAKDVLCEEEFHILWLRYGEEKSDWEISQLIHKKVATIRVILHRTRRKLFPKLHQIKEEYDQ